MCFRGMKEESDINNNDNFNFDILFR